MIRKGEGLHENTFIKAILIIMLLGLIPLTVFLMRHFQNNLTARYDAINAAAESHANAKVDQGITAGASTEMPNNNPDPDQSINTTNSDTTHIASEPVKQPESRPAEAASPTASSGSSSSPTSEPEPEAETPSCMINLFGTCVL